MEQTIELYFNYPNEEGGIIAGKVPVTMDFLMALVEATTENGEWL